MPQEHRVVCCFQCRKFQTDIVKKARKWTCKLCGTRQSLVKEFARSSSGKECRLLMQQLSERSIEGERLEQLVAEQVLEGRIELPQVVEENSVLAESERLVSHHEAGRKGNGHEGEGKSKWESFCRKEEEEEDLVGSWGTTQGRNNSWQKQRTTGSRMEVTGNGSFRTKGSSKPTNQPGTGSQNVPLMDFHRMDKKEKKQFNWESKNAENLNSASGKKPLFTYKPKTVAKQDLSDENSASKRKSDCLPCQPTRTPLMAFTKKSKWDKFEQPASNIEESQSQAVYPKMRDQGEFSDPAEDGIKGTPLMSFSSKSKWNRFEQADATNEKEATEDFSKLNSSHTEMAQINSHPTKQEQTAVSTSKWARFIPKDDEYDEFGC